MSALEAFRLHRRSRSERVVDALSENRQHSVGAMGFPGCEELVSLRLVFMSGERRHA